MSNKTYITDNHNLNDSSIAASSKAVFNGLSALMDNIIVATNAAVNSQTAIPNNNALELSNRIEQVAAALNAVDVGVTSFNGSKGDISYTAPVTSVNGTTGEVTVGTVRSINGANADATGDVDAISMMMPDYSAGVQFTINTSGYTAPANGYIMGDFNADGGDTALLYINGKAVGHDCNSGQAICFPVSKGAFIRVTTGTFSHGNYFYPVKGA